MGDVSGVTTTLTTLSADDVDAEVEALLDVLGVADHVHVDNAIGMKLIDNSLGGDTDGGDEKLSAGLDNNVDELAKLALGVVIAKWVRSAQRHSHVTRAAPPAWG